MADSFTSELAERLLRRATRPVGVIDVRPAQQRYERGAAWPRQHLATLDRAAARHQTDATPGQDQRLLLAARSLDAAVPLRDLMSSDAATDALRSTQTPVYSPASLARIAARQRSGAAEAPAAPSATATSASRDEGPSRGPTRGETIVGPAMRAVSRSSADLPLPSRSTHHADRSNQREQSSSRADGDGTVATRTARDAATPIAATETAAVSTPARASVVRAPETEPATIDAPHVLVQRRHAAPPEPMSPATIQKPTAAPSIVPEVVAQRAQRAPTESDLSLARARRPAIAPEMPARPSAPALNAVAVGPAAGAASPATARAVADPVSAPAAAPDREPALSLRRPVRAVPSPRDSGGAQTPAAAPAAATERTSIDPAPLQLVWRRGTTHDTHGSSAVTAAGGLQGSSSVAASGHSASASAWPSSPTIAAADAAAAMAASTGAARDSGGGGSNLDEIIDEVMRRLADLQTVERERRGDPWL